jgi:hypothetical protein
MTTSKRMRWAGHVARNGRKEVHTGFWWGSLRERDNLETPRRRWEHNTKINIQKMGQTGRDWIYLAQDRDR